MRFLRARLAAATAATICLTMVAGALPAAAQPGASTRPTRAAMTPLGTSMAIPTVVTPQRADLPVAIPFATLPGGGTRIFADKNYVALYGHPGAPALGVMGEQGTAATIRRAKKFAASYRPHTSRTVVPALEVITTVATAGAGKDGDYSREPKPSYYRPLIDAAGRAGVYVVLDLQPGRSSFLTQAKRYRELLLLPHVGLALDPEWRLKPGQKHLRQIGSVHAKEINQVSAWLANLTREARLPQKMLLLHQFTTSMIKERSTLNTRHPEVAMVIQMDGFGSQGAKQGTWKAIRRNAPKGIVFGWKNFIDEDRPMLSPKATMKVKPQPRWVSFQ